METIDRTKYPRVTQILQAMGLADFSKIPERDRDYYMERGQQNHLAWQMIEEGKGDRYDFDPVVQRYIPAHARFLRESGFKAIKGGIEKKVWNDELRYRGTLDRLGMMQGRTVLLDYKTTALVPATHIQTALYLLALPLDFHKVERYGVAFRNDGTYAMSSKYPLTDKNEAIYYANKFHKENPND